MNIMGILLIIAGIIALVLFYFIFSYLALWVQALVSGAKVGLINIIFMRFRKVPPKLIVESKIMAVKAGIDISTDALESHYLAGGNVARVVQALIAADKANIALSFNRSVAIDLAGRNVLGQCRCRSTQKSLKHRLLLPWPRMESSSRPFQGSRSEPILTGLWAEQEKKLCWQG